MKDEWVNTSFSTISLLTITYLNGSEAQSFKQTIIEDKIYIYMSMGEKRKENYKISTNFIHSIWLSYTTESWLTSWLWINQNEWVQCGYLDLTWGLLQWIFAMIRKSCCRPLFIFLPNVLCWSQGSGNYNSASFSDKGAFLPFTLLARTLLSMYAAPKFFESTSQKYLPPLTLTHSYMIVSSLSFNVIYWIMMSNCDTILYAL